LVYPYQDTYDVPELAIPFMPNTNATILLAKLMKRGGASLEK
jgi:hypothetical protein